MTSPSTEELRRRIADAEAELQALREQLAQAEAEELASEQTQPTHDDASTNGSPAWKWPLQAEEYERYARQLILPGVGVKGQLRLKSASVLIVGAGGLGCPAATYLAGAGVGHIAVVDGDVVEASNLHRQIGHATGRVGQFKVDSLVASLRQLNPLPRYTAHREALTPANADRLIGGRAGAKDAPDLVLDCTDHPAVRYLVSDACVRAGVPLVSAAALRTDGQLSVLNWPVGAGPCYRCVFPRPPPAASQTSCAEGGVLGPAVGAMGVLQALEAIRVLVAAELETAPAPPPTLLLFSAGGAGGALGPPTFRSVRLKGRRADCFACSPNAPLQQLRSLEDVGSSSSGADAWPDYVQFCGGNTATNQSILQPDERISVAEYSKVLKDERSSSSNSSTATAPRHWLLDVREEPFYNMGSLEGAVNIPFSRVQTAAARSKGKTSDAESVVQPLPEWLPTGLGEDSAPVYLICRVGNDSQVVTRQLKELGLDQGGKRFIGDIRGGILAWKREIDSTTPFA